MNNSLTPLAERQTLRVRRSCIANVIVLLNSIVYWGAAATDNIATSQTVFLILLLIHFSGSVVFTIIIYSGWNLQFKEPSLTLPHMLWVMAGLSVAVYLTDNIRTVYIPGYTLMLVFGCFKLSLPSFAATAILTLLGYVLATLAVFYERPENVVIAHEIIMACAFFIALCSLTIMTSEFRQISSEISESRDKYQAALNKIETIAIIDELTGLYNRRYLMDILNQQRALVSRGGYRFVVCFVSIDNYDNIEETLQQHESEQLLKKFSQVTKNLLRNIDYAARFGREDFVFILANINVSQAIKVAQRFQEQIHSSQESTSQPQAWTLSIGATECHFKETAEDVLNRAHQLMHQARHLGGNQIITG